MNTEELKIKEYAVSIEKLPHNPSAAGYSAEELKRAFDARSDGEIKEKHNALVDALEEESDARKTENAELKEEMREVVSAHNISETSHKDIRLIISELTSRLNALADSDDITLDQLSEIIAYIKDNRALIELARSTYATQTRQGVVRFATLEEVHNNDDVTAMTPFGFDVGLKGKCNWDVEGEANPLLPPNTNYLHNYVSKALTEYVKSSDYATEDDFGVVRIATTDETIYGESSESVLTPRTARAAVERGMTIYTIKSDDENGGDYPPSTAYMKKYVSENGGSASVEYATQDIAGIVKLASIDDITNGSDTTALTPKLLDLGVKQITIKTLEDAPEGASIPNPTSVEYVQGYVNSKLGDISSALDELHAYAVDLLGGAE